MPGEDSNYKLTYFNSRGFGEAIRLLFHYKGIPFEDNRIPLCKEEPDLKTWKALKPKLPYGQVPVLEFDACEGDSCEHRELAQSHTILRYLANKYYLAGQNAWERAKVDELAEWFKDIWNDYVPYLMVAIGLKKGEEPKLYNETFLPLVNNRFVPIFGRKLKESGSGFVLPSGLSWVDFVFAELCTTFNSHKDGEFFKQQPEFAEYMKRVHSANDLVKKYVAGRPDGKF